MKITGYIFALLTIFSISASAQTKILEDFKVPCDSLSVLMQERTGVVVELKLNAVMKRGSVLDFYFNESLGDFPLRPKDTDWLKATLKSLYPEQYRKYGVGTIQSRKVDTRQLEIHPLTFNGHPASTNFKTKKPNGRKHFVERADVQEFNKGLSGRNIAVWQSHGRYFDDAAGKWDWQRPCLFQTVEDMFTQSFVLPYLVPMLENAGAYVMLPRERDLQTNEIIADNDSLKGGRGISTYIEKGAWKQAGAGFADSKPIYERTEMPFTMGTARKSSCTSSKSKANTAEWRPEIPERGNYAVYVSYASLPESTEHAEYTVRHLGGETRFIVNQKMGGGTWVYLGTFEFGNGTEGFVRLTSQTPEGYRFDKDKVVTADAVKFGGGIGASGMPRSAEGATYWLQWAGADTSVFHPEGAKSQYMDDYMSRGDWVDWISGGSDMNPRKSGKGVPVDLSFGFHTDAGVTPNDSIVGTLAIYTYRSERETKLPDGESRLTSREYADIVQSQIVHDLRAEFNSEWSRRQVWDRGYRESRTPSCPAMLLELLSHQNFADMKYGLDPAFRFTVSRSVYKGMLKYLSNRYGVPYVVQPLPVEHAGVRFSGDDKAVISWKPRHDRLEPTAEAEGFILYTRLDDGAFDQGQTIKAVKEADGTYTYETDIQPGHIYSYRIEAFNEGGKSFPSETISIGIPENAKSNQKVLVVNNFDRVSGPAVIDTPTYAGFDNRLDSGVPHIQDIAFIGEMYQFRRGDEWISNDRPGFGASYRDYAGKTVAGNTFDYPYVHGKSVMNAGYAFYSCSNETFSSDSTFSSSAWALDLICGKQITTVTGSEERTVRYTVFPYEMQDALTSFTERGGHILVSGANIGTDIEDGIYSYRHDKEYVTGTSKFAKSVLGYRWVTNSASRTGEMTYQPDSSFVMTAAPAGMMYTEPNPDRYSIESPDGIAPASVDGKSIMKYSDTGISAGIYHQGVGYKTVCLGFPIEALKEETDINTIIINTLEFFNR